jgi:ribose transport system substrate-binding protein
LTNDFSSPAGRGPATQVRCAHWLLGAVAITATLALSACGSSSAGDPATEIPAAVAPGVATAQTAVDKLLKPPTTIGLTEPLKARPKGGSMVFITCDQPGCSLLNSGMKSAAQTAGMDYTTLKFTSSQPATLVTALKSALKLKPRPTAVSFGGIPEAVWGGVVPAYAAAGIALVPIGAGAVTASPALPAGSLYGPADSTVITEGVAHYFVADSKGKGKAIVLSLEEVGMFKQMTDVFKTTTTKLCPTCSVKTLDVTLAQIANNRIIPAIISELLKDPSIKYVVAPNGSYTQLLNDSLKERDIPAVHVIGANPDVGDLQNIQAGKERAFVSSPLRIIAWKAVDVALRHQQKMPMAEGDGPTSFQLITKENVGSTIEDAPDKPADYANQFKKLWLIP